MRRTKMKMPKLSYEQHNQLVTIALVIAIIAGLGMVWALGHYTGSVDTMVYYRAHDMLKEK
jgi:hypothetical protein